MLIGSGLNTEGPLTAPTYGPEWVNLPVGNWASYHRRLTTISDGTSNTIMVGSRCIATQVYSQRGCTNFTLTNNTTNSCNDDPITNPGPGVFGTLRAMGPDDVWWVSGSSGTVFPGHKYLLQSGWNSWYYSTIAIVRDARDLDSWNRWGSPYSSGTPICMADASVHMFPYSTSQAMVLALCTPVGGETVTVPD
jgi:hypothetical protein